LDASAAARCGLCRLPRIKSAELLVRTRSKEVCRGIPTAMSGSEKWNVEVLSR
jgi:hypothetical protein